MKMVDSALETLGDDVQNTFIEKILAALVRDSGGQKVPPIPKFLNVLPAVSSRPFPRLYTV